MLNTLNGLFIAAVLAGTPLLLGALGEILTEKSGNLNLGVEGMMFMGAITGLAGSYYYEQAVIGSGGNPNGAVSSVIALLTSFAAGSLGALIYSFLTITLRANQNVTGLTLTIFGTGFGNFFGEYIGQKAGGYVAVSEVTKKAFSGIDIPVLSDIPVLGPLLFRYNWVVYFAIAAALFMTWFFNRTSATSIPLAGLHVAKITSATASHPYPLTQLCTHTPDVVTMLIYIPPIPQIPPPITVAIYLYTVVLIPAASAVAGSSPTARRFMICSRTLLRYLFL